MPGLGDSRWERLALWIWLLLAVGIAVRLGLVEANPRRNNVYLKVFAQAGDAFVNGGSLYYAPDGSTSGFRYPPLSAVLFVPFAWCGPVLGSILWRLFSFTVLLLGLRACIRAAFPWAMSSRERGVFLLLVALSGIGSLNNGQTNPLILGLLLLATTGTLGGRNCGPAAGVVGSVVLKLYPLAYGLVLGVLRPRQLLWLVPLFAVAFAVPFALQDPSYVAEQYRQMYAVLSAEDRTQDGLWNAYRDLRLVARSVGSTLPDPLFHLLQVVGGAGIVGVSFLLRRAGARPRVVLEYAFSLTMCWFMLLGPATEKATYIFVAPSLAWSLLSAWRHRQQDRGMFVLLVAANCLAQSALFPIDRDQGSTQTWLWCLLPYAALVLAVALVRRAVGDLRRLRRDGAADA